MTTLALVGSGRWGKNYIKTIRNLSSCRLPDEFIKTKNYKDLFFFNNIDGVIVATPASTHFRIAKEFLEKDFNVLIEKPLTTNYKDALKLCEIAKKMKSIAMVGHIFLYNSAFLELKKQINKIGKIKSITSEGMDDGPIRSDVSALWDWGPHDVSMLIDLLGIPLSASALETGSNPDDSYTLTLNYINDFSTFSKISRTSPLKKRNMTIVGENKTIIFDDTIEKKIAIVDNLNKKTTYPSFSKTSPLSEEISSFVELIVNKKKINKSDLKMGSDVVKIIEACEKSIKLGGENIKIK